MTIGPATVVIIAEHKEPLPATVTDGITLFTTHVRRAAPDTLDPKLNSHSKLNDITRVHPGLHGRRRRGADARPARLRRDVQLDALLHRRRRRAEVLTSDGRYCLAGITRANVLEICRANGIPARETTFSLTDVYAAREAFVTGTFAGVVPVRSVDGRTIGDGRRGPVVERLQALYRELVDADVAARVAAVSDVVRVAMWSGPRNISTAMMRAFENRPDTVVVDEPLYAAYLARTGIDHPAREEVIASQPTDLETADRRPVRAAAVRPPASTTPSTWRTTSPATWICGWTLSSAMCC